MRRHDVGSSKFSVVMLAILLGLSFSIAGCESKPKVSTAAAKKRPKTGNRPQIAVGGSAPSAAPEATTESKSEAPAISTVADMQAGLPNGLFPQMSLSFRQNGFGGGLVPDFQHPFADPDAADSSQTSAAGSDEVEEFVSNEVADQTAPQGLMAKAVEAFRERHDSDAFKYLYSDILCDDEMAAKYPLKWFSGISRPKIALRFGVGVTYSSPRDYSGKPPVVGDPEDVRLPGASSQNNQRGSSGRGSTIGAGGGGGGGGGSTGTADSPYANVDTSNPEGFLLYYTGDFGDRLLTQLESRRLNDDAFFGMALKDIGVDYAVQPVSASAPGQAAAPSRTRGNRQIGTGGGPGGGAAPVGDGVISGNAAAGATGPRTERLERVRGSSAAADPDSELSGSLSPGVLLVGEGKKEDLIDRAREMGLDVLFMFNVRVSSSRVPTSTTGLKVVNLHSDDAEVLYTSRSLKSDVVAKNRDAGINEKSDPVVQALDLVFEEMLDDKLRAQPLPENLKPEHVAGRIMQLMEQSNPDPLAAAVEIVGFHRMELLDAELAEKALDKVLGDGKGKVLLTGTSEERQAVLAEYLPTGDSD
jgi:hypothetical protein